MRRIPRIVPVAIFVLATPFLMGTEKCDGDEQLARIIHYLVEQVEDLDARVSDLEACDCEGFLEPVCGDDGSTYVNSCEAACAEVAIQSGGLCPVQMCGGDTGLTCEEGDFCETPAGCDDTQVGHCVGIPEECSRELDPVCGCDGKTYRNDCLRLSSGVGLDHPGQCIDVPIPCDSNDECTEDEFCSTTPGTCDGAGQCLPRPEACTLDINPVCGCDGKTYSNVCEANANGVTVAARGACEPVLCDLNTPCETGELCKLEEGVCQRDVAGVCVPLPDDCRTLEAPVCGCDGNTYQNACQALVVPMPIASDGECGTAPSECRGDDDCESGSFCNPKAGECGGNGICTEIPSSCEPQNRPVCGCDGNDYRNPCEAALAGTAIAGAGACADDDSCGGVEGLMCDDPEVCLYKTLGCDEAEVGTCSDLPKACTDGVAVSDPVCGCDGNSYRNECAALENGVRVASMGECTAP